MTQSGTPRLPHASPIWKPLLPRQIWRVSTISAGRIGGGRAYAGLPSWLDRGLTHKYIKYPLHFPVTVGFQRPFAAILTPPNSLANLANGRDQFSDSESHVAMWAGGGILRKHIVQIPARSFLSGPGVYRAAINSHFGPSESATLADCSLDAGHQSRHA